MERRAGLGAEYAERGVVLKSLQALRIELDVEEYSLDSMHLEHWLAEHIICRIPGASGERK